MTVKNSLGVRPLRFARYDKDLDLVISTEPTSQYPLARGRSTYVTANEYWTIYKDADGWNVIVQESPTEQSDRIHTMCRQAGLYYSIFRTRSELVKALEEIMRTEVES